MVHYREKASDKNTSEKHWKGHRKNKLNTSTNMHNRYEKLHVKCEDQSYASELLVNNEVHAATHSLTSL